MVYTKTQRYHGKCRAIFNHHLSEDFHKLGIAMPKSLNIVPGVITVWRPIALALVLAPLGLLCGCSGINRSIDISPATFLLPGLVQQPQPASSIPESSFIAKESELTVAQGK